MSELSRTKNNINLLILISIVLVSVFAGILIVYSGNISYAILISLASIPFVLLTIKHPVLAIMSFFFFIPLERIYLLPGGHTLTKLVGLYLVLILVLTGRFRYISETFKNKKTILILLYFAVACTSLLLSKSFSNSVHGLQILFFSIISYFVLVMLIRDENSLTYILWSFVIGGTVSVLSTAVLGYGRVGVGGGLSRLGGLWGDQNEFAALLLVLIPIAVSLILTSKKKLLKLIFTTSLVILFVGFILTYSRGGFIALCVLVLLALIETVRGKNRIKLLMLLIPLIIAGSVIFYITVADKYISRIETMRLLESRQRIRSETSIDNRYYYYFELAPKIFYKSPILGVGFRDFISHNPEVQVTHNTYLEVLTGTGILGFIPFMLILFLTWKDFRNVQVYTDKYKNRKLLYYSKALELGFLSYLITALFITLDINKMLWICITLSTVLLNIYRVQRKHLEGSGNYPETAHPA